MRHGWSVYLLRSDERARGYISSWDSSGSDRGALSMGPVAVAKLPYRIRGTTMLTINR